MYLDNYFACLAFFLPFPFFSFSRVLRINFFTLSQDPSKLVEYGILVSCATSAKIVPSGLVVFCPFISYIYVFTTIAVQTVLPWVS
ncbi:hypothetical protein F4818DRAFT_415966 [Hypoxylon cercidicola]|nr:hypothetical protein F4818DRAFT_415966 [Hypoxylon cercidicola]